VGDWSLNYGGGRIATVGLNTGNSRGVTVTANGSTNTKAATYTELSAATPFEAAGVMLHFSSNTQARYMFDLAIGASSSEVNIIDNIYFYRGGQPESYYIYFPVRVPGGERLSVRSQSDVSAAVCYVAAMLFPPGPTFPESFSRCTTYGATTASTTGATVTGHTSGNTKNPTWSQISASITNPIRSAVVAVGPGSDVTTAASTYFLLDIGVGAASSEVVCIPDISLYRDANTDRPGPVISGPFPMLAPSGKRLAATTACSVTTAGDRNIECVVYGLD
jgi:hypothetical protein